MTFWFTVENDICVILYLCWISLMLFLVLMYCFFIILMVFEYEIDLLGVAGEHEVVGEIYYHTVNDCFLQQTRSS